MKAGAVRSRLVAGLVERAFFLFDHVDFIAHDHLLSAELILGVDRIPVWRTRPILLVKLVDRHDHAVLPVGWSVNAILRHSYRDCIPFVLAEHLAVHDEGRPFGLLLEDAILRQRFRKLALHLLVLAKQSRHHHEDQYETNRCQHQPQVYEITHVCSPIVARLATRHKFISHNREI